MNALVAKMKQLYVARNHSNVEKQLVNEQVRAHAKRFTWYETGTAVLQRLKALLEGELQA